MRLQHVSVMFVIIFIPIILVTSYFISLQVNTIKLESDYSNKLLKATYDAMTAFELNTANENLSSVSDSLRSIIDASTNIFFNTLCTNLGVSNASKTFVQPYIPSILYTLYDGYYIYSPTNIPTICTDDFGRTIRTSDYGVKYTTMYDGRGVYEFDKKKIEYDANNPTEPVKANDGYVVEYNSLPNEIKDEYAQILYKNKDGSYSTKLHTYPASDSKRKYSTEYRRDYILKSYIPYSARYSGSGYDITINYTLDNFLTVEGTIGEIYYSKSGYLIESDLVKKINVGDTAIVDIDNGLNDWTVRAEVDLIEMINDPENWNISIELKDGVTISNRDGEVSVENPESSGSTTLYWDDAKSALEYYIKSYIFSSWFYENLSSIKASDLKNTEYSITDIEKALTESTVLTEDLSKTELDRMMLHNFESDGSLPFSNLNNNPESDESPFYEHKRNVIKNSITYNLILSMLVYTEESKTLEYNMPIFTESEWNTILNNISITSFMQGMRCGLKYYNNYAIVTSTNNEITVTDNEIYYTPRVVENVDTSGDGVADRPILAALDDNYAFETAHRIDCEELILNNDDSTKGPENFFDGNWLGCLSFKSKEIKYDKVLNKDGTYTYDHKVYTDYDCIVDSNYVVHNKGASGELNGSIKDGNYDTLDYLIENVSSDVKDLKDNINAKLKSYRIAIAKERNNLYKTTAFPENYGWQVVMNPSYNPIDPSEVIDGTSDKTEISLSGLSKKKLSEILKIEVTIEGANIDKAGIYTSEIKARFNTGDDYDITQTISTTSKSRRTLEFKQDFDSTSEVTSVTISSDNETKFNVNSVKVYFK